MRLQYFLIVSMLIAHAGAVAQTACPTGVAAGSAQCGPSPASHGVNSAPPIQPQVRYVPTGRWRTTWGAVASNKFGTGDVGVTVGKFSKTEAVSEAISHCEKTSGSECRLSLAYENQCVAIVWASTNGANNVGTTHTSTGPSLEAASLDAAAACDKKADSGECKIVYSDCTKPVYEKF